MDKNNQKATESLVLSSVFYNKPLYLYVFKKVTKIASALYLITDLIKDSEPLKWSLRKEALESMSLISSFKDISMFSKETVSHLMSIRSMLEIGKISKSISEMNAGILDKEVLEIFDLLNKESQNLAVIESSFFTVDHPEISFNQRDVLSGIKMPGEIHKGHSKGHNNNDFFNQIKNTYKTDKNLLTRQKDQRIREKGQRREEIIKIIKLKQDSTIKDITSVIKDCSEKTVQRELTSLLEEGLIKKTGERRWSRYSII